ncbi:putative 2-dehydropantoate 2-reductase [Aspergillus heteromorphus CBS 117.55]|uniref:2-dehydropantoate 2-reductase n=1 Tax=Aspergillus heteromorphus CBS 117.55 TaxID=1448321 RepID=A0A317W941_9EURO|nr:putative 2-dehydropantoate 2-reductase [Aspergillus heteromorphus CBS 117.55]PWY82251.1 putative 2-dehydropantoate 2-reductase [Aspergillus heteromorphus CBS 117.55]
MLRSWLKQKRTIELTFNGLNDGKKGFDVDVLDGQTWHSIPDGFMEGAEEAIECLIVTVKAPMTALALDSVRHRLTPESTVLFLQNGMGVIEEINEKLFPDPQTRPNYMQGLISHGLSGRQKPFQVAHAGVGTTILGPSENKSVWAPSTKYLLRIMTLTPSLVAVAETPSSLMLYQLEKLAMNSVINPMTAVIGCKNGELLYNYSFTRLMRLLLLEISSVICALPEVQGIPGIESRFSPERLRWMVTQLASKTAENRSSMLQDVTLGKSTEIEYLNGYIVRRGEDLGFKCVVNYMIKHLVIGKQLTTKSKDASTIPIDIE